jgi:hypothetical protein
MLQTRTLKRKEDEDAPDIGPVCFIFSYHNYYRYFYYHYYGN